jgi:DNA-binding Xre family transcriptional regulator
VTSRLGYRWRLRELMAAKGMWQTTDLRPLLAERGVVLSSVQVYRLVTQTPERLNLRTLVALCDILDCTSDDLIERVTQPLPKRKAATGSSQAAVGLRPTPARITRPSQDRPS